MYGNWRKSVGRSLRLSLSFSAITFYTLLRLTIVYSKSWEKRNESTCACFNPILRDEAYRRRRRQSVGSTPSVTFDYTDHLMMMLDRVDCCDRDKAIRERKAWQMRCQTVYRLCIVSSCPTQAKDIVGTTGQSLTESVVYISTASVTANLALDRAQIEPEEQHTPSLYMYRAWKLVSSLQIEP